MPDEPRPIDESLKALLPPILMGLGVVSLVKNARLLGLAMAGAWLFDAACRVDRDRHARGRTLAARRKASRAVDIAMEDTFPASDPPSYMGNSVGAP